MNRRTLLRRLGATGVAATAVAGTSAARTAPTDYGIDREIDVSDVAGRVTLETLLSEAELQRLHDGVDPARREFVVQEDVDAISLEECCTFCCDGTDYVCPGECDCCECELPPCH